MRLLKNGRGAETRTQSSDFRDLRANHLRYTPVFTRLCTSFSFKSKNISNGCCQSLQFMYILYNIFFKKSNFLPHTRQVFYKNQDTLFYFLNLLYRLSYLPMVGRVGLEPTTRASLKQNINCWMCLYFYKKFLF